MKVLVLTTSYPRGPDDPAGNFVASMVEAARTSGVEVDIVSPASFRHFGIAYGHGIVGNLRARPWLALLLPAFFWNFRREAIRRDCDLVHAHWLLAGAVAATLRRPYLVQVWGTDVELARRTPWVARAILRRARLTIGASAFLAEEARRLGAADVRVVPTAVPIPETVGKPDEPAHVLFAGRLSPEKGIDDFLAATNGLPRVVVGSGPVDVPESLGAVPPREIGRYYERAAVVCVPSRREGYGMVAREAMAYGRPVVATPVGGLVDAVDDGETGVLAARGALRDAVERMLADANLRAQIGAAAREKARRAWSEKAAAAALIDAYEKAIGPVGRLGAIRGGPSTFAPMHEDVLTHMAGARRYNRWLFDRGKTRLGDRVLDVGAGIGTFTELAASYARSVTALEPDPAFATLLRKRFPRIDVLQANVTELDVADRAGTFDSIICFNVLEHVADDEMALRVFRELLGPNGSLLLLVPAHEWLSSPFDRAVGHERRYTADLMRAMLARTGFAAEEVRYVNPVGALGWLVSMRFAGRRELPGRQVRLFDHLVPLLRPLDRIRFPFGQSLWVVAQKC